MRLEPGSLVRRAEGRTPEELARQFEPSAQAIRNCVRQADRNDRRAVSLLTDTLIHRNVPP